MFGENYEYEILTPSGWKDFRGISSTPNKKIYRMMLADGSYVDSTMGHHFFSNGIPKKLSELSIGEHIDTINKSQTIISIDFLKLDTVYDIIEVQDPDHAFIINGNITSKNCDELSYVGTNIANSMWASISPTLSTGGRAIITSTPNTDEDLFATIWKGAMDRYDEYGQEQALGKNGFHAYRAYWRDHPDRDDAWAAAERGKIGEEKFRREFDCEFISFEETLINSIFLATMDGNNPKSIMGQSRWYKELSKDKMYAIALDPSLGTGGDNAAIQVFELPNFEQVAEWSNNLTPIQGQIKILREILNYILLNIGNENINNIYWSIENNTIGEAGLVCIQDIGEDKLPGLFLCEPAKKGMVKKTRKGFNTTHRTKVNAAARLKYLIESGKMKIHSKLLISELKNYIASGVSFKGKNGETDDLVSALLLIIRMSHVLSDWDSTVFESFSSSDENMEDSFSYPMPIYISSY